MAVTTAVLRGRAPRRFPAAGLGPVPVRAAHLPIAWSPRFAEASRCSDLLADRGHRGRDRGSPSGRGREVVVGSVGQFWQPVIPLRQTAHSRGVWPGVVFGSPGSVGGRGSASTCAWARPILTLWRDSGRTGLTAPVLTCHAPRTATDDRQGWERWTRKPLPGDGILPHSRSRTHAVTIEAPVDRVWPWLVQMGCRRGGWRSFDRLDNGESRARDPDRSRASTSP